MYLNLNTRRFAIVMALFLLIGQGLSAQTIYYVNYGSGSNSNPGTSWSNAFRDLTKALAVAQSSTASEVDIWVAAGTYTPIDGVSPLPTDHKDTSFTFYRGDGIGKALKVYGGFAGTESSISARDSTHITYLEGSLGSENSYHVGIIAGLAATADSVVLDGFTIKNGLADSGRSKIYNGISIAQYIGGGLVMISNLSPRLAIRKCLFYNNKVSSTYGVGYGGGIYMNNSYATFEKTQFVSNLITSYYTSTAPACVLEGGAIYATGCHLIFTRCYFALNSSASSNNGISGGGAIFFDQCIDPLISYCAFRHNSSGNTSSGGANYLAGGAIVNSNSDSHIKSCVFAGNQINDHLSCSSSTPCSQAYGAAIYNRSSSVVVDSSTVDSNEVHSFSYTNLHGGGATADSNSASLYTNNTFSRNIAGEGGAMYIDISRDTIKKCNFIYSNAAVGGAIQNKNNSGSYFSDCTFSASSASYSGGNLYNQTGASLYMYNDTIENGGAISGAGIANDGYHLTTIKCTFLYNGSYAPYFSGTTNRGGAIYTSSATSIDSCVFNTNKGDDGGAIWAAGTTLEPKHCVFTGNSASVNGGAIFFQGNSTGGTLLSSNGNAYINNKAQYGGAIQSSFSSTTPGTDSLVNNIFIGNKGLGGQGGAIFVYGATHFICNNTFYKNDAYLGGSIAAYGLSDYVTMFNNIFYGGTTSGGYGAATVDTAIRATGLFYFYNNITTGTDPLFVDTTNFTGGDGTWFTADDGLALQKCSPGVNVGNNAYVTSTENTDCRQNTRIIGGQIDLGAYETVTIGSITGASSVCFGSTITLSDTSSGGTWSSSTPAVATISATGIVTAISAGITTISYAHSTSCTSDIETKIITVVRPASVITGPDSVCIFAAITLTDSVANGVWSSSSSAIATIDSTTGLLNGVSTGNATITYHLVNACGTYNITKLVYVNPLPVAATISGPTTVCEGKNITLAASASGGTWNASNSNATISSSGVVTGVSAGTITFTYSITNSCGGATSNYPFTVYSAAYCDSVAAVTKIIPAGSGLFVYPNPTQGSVTLLLQSNTIETVTIKVTNILGEQVKEWSIVTNKTEDKNLGLPAGVYLLTATIDSRKYVVRLVVE